MPQYQLLNVGNNAKTVKSDKLGEYQTAILYLAPGMRSGYQVCPFASKGCEQACLYTAGMGDSKHVREAPIRKTKMLFEDRQTFFDLLVDDIHKFVKDCFKKEMKPAIRLNGTSDIQWENEAFEMFGKRHASILDLFAGVMFYDYTKIPGRKMRKNYYLTFSLAEDNFAEAEQERKTGKNISVVFANRHFPKKYMGLPVIDGDEHDLRFLDMPGVIVGLKAKGDAKKDELGFTHRNINQVEKRFLAKDLPGPMRELEGLAC